MPGEDKEAARHKSAEMVKKLKAIRPEKVAKIVEAVTMKRCRMTITRSSTGGAPGPILRLSV